MENITMEEWLSALYNCDYIITDSFHGACCAILFKKKFICLKNKCRGTSRFETLEKTFDIKDNFIFEIRSYAGTTLYVDDCYVIDIDM